MTCTFFGHKDTPGCVRECLMPVLRKLITEQGVNAFLVGNQGVFDHMVVSALQELENEFQDIRYQIVLAYMPGDKQEYTRFDYTKTIYPEGLEHVPLRYAISWRNKWMVRQADIVVTYIAHSWGSASQFASYAVHQKKTVIDLAEQL